MGAVAIVAACAMTALVVLTAPDKQRSPRLPPAKSDDAVNRPFPWPESPFRNTREGTYVGSDKCIECHADDHEGFRHSGMGRSMARHAAGDEPRQAVVEHPPSGRRYEVVRDGGQMRHRERIATAAGRLAVVNDHPVAYVIGSGNHARGYLVEIDGFLVESPLTWYQSRQAWDMSPGYEGADQLGLQRPVDQGCLICHAGRSRALDGTFHKMEIIEGPISCERCHGPGSLHVARQEKGDATNTLTPPRGGTQPQQVAIDDTIVNPKHLSRELADDVCAQCHLRSVASCLVRGRELADFRPGLPLSAFRIDFRLGQGQDEMTVVGHVQQMRASRCYQRSPMTCMTCHNPHEMPQKDAGAAYYRGKCLSCHVEADCRLDAGQRLAAGNDCVKCHMPTSPIDIPHLTFTHHRVGIHPHKRRGLPPTEPDEPAELVPLADLSSWSEADRARVLGGAYLELSQSKEGARFGKHYQQHSLDLLVEAWEAGLRDADLAAKLAQFTAVVGDPRAIEFAEHILAQPDVPARFRGNALLAKADWHRRRGEFEPAADAARELTQVRRASSDWALLGELLERCGQHEEGVAAIEKAAEIDPANAGLRQALVDYFRRRGDHQRAKRHADRLPRQ
jgi:hypothetical protein